MTGQVKREPLVDVSKLTVNARRMAGGNVVAKSFKAAGISNKLDGTNNDIVWDSQQEPSQSYSDRDTRNDNQCVCRRALVK